MKQTLQSIVNSRETRMGRVFDTCIQTLIVLSLVAFSLETVKSFEPWVYKWLYIFELSCIGVFTVEYILRIYVAESRLKYIFSFFGLIDLLSILPFYLTQSLHHLQTIRSLRLIRLLRLVKLVRYNRAMLHLTEALKLAKEELVLFWTATIVLMYLAAVGIYYFEHEAQPEIFASVFDSLWWAVATLTTVGYGDVYPVTAGGRLFTFFILMLGLGVVSVPTGILASAMTTVRARETKDAEKRSMLLNEQSGPSRSE